LRHLHLISLNNTVNRVYWT